MSHKIVVAGAGGIGRAVGLILAEKPSFDCKIFIGDINLETAKEAANWIEEGAGVSGVAQAFEMPKTGASDEMKGVFAESDVVLDCLPGSQAPRMAKMSKENGCHYANLTEYVAETQQIMEIAADADTGFVLQTGLAPGFINVLAHKLYQQFCAANGVEKVDKITMKVGALTQHACAPHFYGFTWSPIGVSTEYLKDAEVVRDGEKRNIPALSDCNTIIIDNITYEDNLTSGGAANLPDFLAGKVIDLDYKTLRYPGHYEWVKQTVSSIPTGKNKIDELERIMKDTIPMVEDDVVIIYSSVEGKDKDGNLRAIEKSYSIKPSKVGTKTLRAIQTTTASPLAECAQMLVTGNYKGVVLQSDLNTDDFLNGVFVKDTYGEF